MEVWAEDEVHFQQRGSLTRMWAPCGVQPVLPSAPTREHVSFFGAVALPTGRLVLQTAARFAAETFEAFLATLCAARRRPRVPLVLVVDHARWHKAKALAPFLGAHRQWLRLLFLPPYSPKLNPIERLWRFTRRQVTHNRYFPTRESLEFSLLEFFDQFARPNATLRTLCAVT